MCRKQDGHFSVGERGWDGWLWLGQAWHGGMAAPQHYRATQPALDRSEAAPLHRDGQRQQCLRDAESYTSIMPTGARSAVITYNKFDYEKIGTKGMGWPGPSANFAISVALKTDELEWRDPVLRLKYRKKWSVCVRVCCDDTSSRWRRTVGLCSTGQQCIFIDTRQRSAPI